MVTGLYALLCSALFLLQAASAVETVCANNLANQTELEGTYQVQYVDSWGAKVYASSDCSWCQMYDNKYYYRVYGYSTYSFRWLISGTLEDSYTYMYCNVMPLEDNSPVRATECTSDNPNAAWFWWNYKRYAWELIDVEILLCETGAPSPSPSTSPTEQTVSPTMSPTMSPTSPSTSPSMSPTSPSTSPSMPSESPSMSPTSPSTSPSMPSESPSRQSLSPSMPSESPSRQSLTPSMPSLSPSLPSMSPSMESREPTGPPTSAPSSYPTPGPVTNSPTQYPSAAKLEDSVISDNTGKVAGMSVTEFVILLVGLHVCLIAGGLFN